MVKDSFARRAFRSTTKLYKKFDIYSKDLTLTFEGEDKHTTYVGATLTTIIVVFMLVYSVFQLEVLFKKEQTTVNIKSIYEDLTKKYENYSLSDHGFDFALQVSKWGTPVYNESYFYYEVENINSWWAPDEDGVITRYKTSTDLNMQLCTYFNATDYDIKRLGIYQSFYCPKIKDYSIGGAFTSPNYRYLYIKINK
jgi:hypothetical protein